MAAEGSIPASRIPAKSRDVVSYHYDDDRPGKPLYLLIPGGLIAVTAFVAILVVSYRVWVADILDSATGIQLLLLLLLPYFGGLLIFSYGYELYDWPRAIRLTIIAGAMGLAAIVVSVALLYVIRALLGGDSKSSGAKSSRGSDAESWADSSSGSGESSSSRLSINWNTSGAGRQGRDEQPLSLATCPKCGRHLPGGIGSRCIYCDPAPSTMKGSGA